MTNVDLEALAKRCEQTEGPDRALDYAIGAAMGLHPNWTAPAYTKFVDVDTGAPPPFSVSKMIGVDDRAKSLEINGYRFLARKNTGKSAIASGALFGVRVRPMALCAAALRARLAL